MREKSEVFEFNHPSGTIRHEFIKREISVQLSGETYYDLVTPFLYGGPVISDCQEDDKWDLVYEFTEAFEAYCREQRIVSEQVQFNPLASNAVDFAACYEVEYVGDTYGTNLKAFPDPIREEFTESCQKTIWKALEAGMEYAVTEPADLQRFVDFFRSLGGEVGLDIQLSGKKLVVAEALYKGQTVGMSLNFLDGSVLHTYLSAFLPAFEMLPVHVMRFGLTLWGKDKGLSLIHDGGMLFHPPIADIEAYKQQFAKHTSFKFCTGRKIWNEEAYHKLCAATGIGAGADAFPAYRVKEMGESRF